jgi:hypothetical protein
LKKCPRCNAISSDSEHTCGVCGGSLSGVASESLEQLTHKEPKIRSERKLNLGAIALVIVAVTSTSIGAVFLVLSNALGIFLFLIGLVAMLAIVGGAGGGFKTGRVIGRAIGGTKASLQGEEDRREEEERKRRRGEED